MNLPNKLTVLRILLVPFFILVLLMNNVPHHYLFAGLIFGIASITDMFDGKIARKHNLVTDFGKFADPLADKILVISAFLVFVEIGIISSIPVIIVLFREFAVTSVRLVAATSGKVVDANIWGKLKTVSQIVAIVVTLVLYYILELAQLHIITTDATLINNLELYVNIISQIFIYISVVFTIISGVIYIKDNSKFIKQTT